MGSQTKHSELEADSFSFSHAIASKHLHFKGGGLVNYKRGRTESTRMN